MPRNQTQGTTLRNRNRVTNKTRLKVVRGNIDADPLILDEEEERARIIATSGVDADDANEHHLQVAINAATLRHSAFAHDLRLQDTTSQKEKKDSYIPTPDAAGIVADYIRFYPSGRWCPPYTHLRFADTTEDTIRHGLVNGYSYYMDERDKDWLEKNNQLANGESTSAQAIIANGLASRSSRTSKGKGKDPDVFPAVRMCEDEFELIMGLFEKETDERYPFLHVDPTQIPSLSEYEQFFATELSVACFSSFAVPEFASKQSRIIALATAVYPHWRSRRVDSAGHRILAQLNADESNENDPYVCFRRRDTKPIRKTRTAQNAITDRMIRLKFELGQSYSLALAVLEREKFKQSQLCSAPTVWKARAKAIELKRKLGWQLSREEEDLLVDKDRPAKKPRGQDNSKSGAVTKTQQRDSPLQMSEPRPTPKERYQKIQNEIHDEISKHRDKTSSWEDIADFSYQSTPMSLPGRLFTRLPLGDSSNAYFIQPTRSFRLRYGRGGRLHLDRLPSMRVNYPQRSIANPEASWDFIRQEERRRYDSETWGMDCGQDDNDRFLVDDFHARYSKIASTLLTDEDRSALSTDTQSYHPNVAYDGLRNLRNHQQRKSTGESFPRLVSKAQPSPPPALVPSSTPLIHTTSPVTPEGTKHVSGQELHTNINGASTETEVLVLPASMSIPRPLNLQENRMGQGLNKAESALLDQVPKAVMPTPLHQSEINSFQAPSIARHKIQSSNPYLHSQPALHLAPNGGHSVNSGSQLNGDYQRFRHIKQPIKVNLTANSGGAGYLSASPSPGSIYTMANMHSSAYNGHPEASLNGAPLHLKLNRNLVMGSPHLSTEGTSQTIQSAGTNMTSGSSLVCSPSIGNAGLSPPYHGTSSPLNGTYSNVLSRVSPPSQPTNIPKPVQKGSPILQASSLSNSKQFPEVARHVHGLL